MRLNIEYQKFIFTNPLLSEINYLQRRMVLPAMNCGIFKLIILQNRLKYRCE
jgi:hypothetical protein